MTATTSPITPVAEELDPVSLEIMWSRLISTADEMWTTVLRTAVSTIIGAAQDFGCELLDEQGNSLAHSYRSMPVFNLIMPELTRKLIERYPVDSMRPGDVYTTNDPWICAGHLDDIAVITPIFRDGTVVAFANTVAHTSSIGGALDGLAVRDLHEEGFFIPLLKLYDAGEPNDTLFALIASNVRQPEMVLTDIEAQVTANVVATQRILSFMTEYGLDTLADLARTVQSRAERAMRDAIEALPDGHYASEIFVEGADGPVPLRVAIDVRGSDIHVDYNGSAPQTIAGGINCTFTYTRAHTVYPLKCVLTPGVPNNEGCFRPIHVSAPETSILNARPPASVNSRTKTGWHIHTLIFQALADAMPERVQAGNGLMYNIRAYARGADGVPRHAHLISGGGRGAGFGVDGTTRNCFPSSAGNVPVEVFESRVPIIVERNSLESNTAGLGQWRGAAGKRVAIRPHPDHRLPISLYVHPDRMLYPAPGVFGGGDSHRTTLLLNGVDLGGDGNLASGEIVLRAPTDTFESIVAGGAGYGDPAERDSASQSRDIEYGYVSVDRQSDE
ncbi:MAG TPA: hydantoinase B/oxoprolinase family protein [Thermomicrobiales bacterium]|nr:hydantoinase B/oxoprolinase family protein [Thermomicrobiales bacterium]